MPEKLNSSRPLLSQNQVAAEAVFVAILRLSNALATEGDGLFKANNLTPAQYNTLRILRDAGPQGLPCQQISEALISRDPDVTRLADRLEERGLVSKERSAEDRRVVLVRLTASGLELVEKLDWPVALHTEAQIAALSLVEKHQLLALLEKLLAARKSHNCRN